MTIAQDVVSEGLSKGYFTPLVLGAIVYTALFIASRVLDGRGDERSETAADAAFVVILLSAVYVAILAVAAVASEPDLVWDLVRILAVVGVFFGFLLLLLFAVFDLGIGGISRMRHRND